MRSQATNRRYGLIEAVAGRLRGPRQPGKVEHGFVELLGQRIHDRSCSYPEASDAAWLEGDPTCPN